MTERGSNNGVYVYKYDYVESMAISCSPSSASAE